MTALFIVNNEITGILVLAFLHSLWQGLLLSVVAWCLMKFGKNFSPAVRYNLLLILLFSFFGGVLLTCLSLASGNSIIIAEDSSLILTNGNSNKNFLSTFLTWINSNASWLFLGWFFFFLFKVTQLLRALMAVDKIRTTGVNDPSPHWLVKLSEFSKALNIRSKIGLRESALISQPLVIGIMKPLILVPVGFLSGLHPAEVEAVLLHELAHIKRNDYLINLFQNLLESIFFFNPFLFWISDMIRDEREHCCDAVAIAHTKNKKVFLQALLSFQQRTASTSPYVMGLMNNKSLLIKRVDRIIKENAGASSATGKLGLIIAFVILLIGFISVSFINKDGRGAVKGKRNTLLNGDTNTSDTIPVRKMSKEFSDGYKAAQQYLKNKLTSVGAAKKEAEQDLAGKINENSSEGKSAVQIAPPNNEKKKIESQLADEAVTVVQEPGQNAVLNANEKKLADLAGTGNKDQIELESIKAIKPKNQTALVQPPASDWITREATEKKKKEQAVIAQKN